MAEGRDNKGKFAPGNKCSAVPKDTRTRRWNKKLSELATEGDFEKVYEALLAAAIAGEGWAVREYLDRFCGKVPQDVQAELVTSLFKAIDGKAAESV